MKKILSFILVLAIICSFSACALKEADFSDDNTSHETDENHPETALILLENVWAKYEDNEKFFAVGGDYTVENQKTDAPGKFSLEDKDALLSNFCIDENTSNMVDDAASLMHMMLANNFTAIALHVTDSKEIDSVTGSLKENIQNNRWLCGFPQEMYIATVNDYVISVFGASDIIEVFDKHLKEAYADTKVVFQEPIA